MSFNVIRGVCVRLFIVQISIVLLLWINTFAKQTKIQQLCKRQSCFWKVPLVLHLRKLINLILFKEFISQYLMESSIFKFLIMVLFLAIMLQNYDHWGNVICTGKDSLIRDGHKSFPSGHTSCKILSFLHSQYSS